MKFVKEILKTIAKEFTFEAAHRLVDHPGKCYRLHGHSYKVRVEVSGEINGLTGMILDFDVLSKTVGKYIKDYLDHVCLVNNNDIELKNMLSSMFAAAVPPGNEHCYFFIDGETTAENLARHLVYVTVNLLERDAKDCHLHSVSVRVHETETCYAEATVKYEILKNEQNPSS